MRQLHLQWEAILLQAMLKQGWGTFDICRNLIAPPPGYKLSQNGQVTKRMKRNGLILKAGVSVSSRRAAKCGTNGIWRLVSKAIARQRLRDLRDELGSDFPKVTKKDMEEATPRELHWQPRGKRKPIKGQRKLF